MLKNKKYYRYQTMIHILLILVTAFMILPFILLFSASITSEATLLTRGYSIIPRVVSLEAYKYLLTNSAAILRAYGITIFITLFGTVLGVFGMSALAYVLSLKGLPAGKFLAFFIFFSLLFNGGLVPTYLMWTQTFHIKNTIWALIFPNLLMTPMNVILMRTFYMTNIPGELYEAAKIDGAGLFKIYRSVVLPLGKPIFVTIALFTGLSYWNDWMNALYYISDSRLYSLQALLNQILRNAQAMASDFSGDMGGLAIPTNSVRMAIAFIAILPILAVYPFLQKYFQSGIAMGALKG